MSQNLSYASPLTIVSKCAILKSAFKRQRQFPSFLGAFANGESQANERVFGAVLADTTYGRFLDQQFGGHRKLMC